MALGPPPISLQEKSPALQTIQVLCLGREKTGTTSLRAALKILGYHDVYHMDSLVFDDPSKFAAWTAAIESKFPANPEREPTPISRQVWEDLLGGCDAVTDQPCASFAGEFMEAYPDAQLILTVRETIQPGVEIIPPYFFRHRGLNPIN